MFVGSTGRTGVWGASASTSLSGRGGMFRRRGGNSDRAQTGKCMVRLGLYFQNKKNDSPTPVPTSGGVAIAISDAIVFILCQKKKHYLLPGRLSSFKERLRKPTSPQKKNTLLSRVGSKSFPGYVSIRSLNRFILAYYKR